MLEYLQQKEATMLAIKIDNPEMESKFKQYAKQQKKAVEDVVDDALKMFLDAHKKNNELVYVKKDPMKHAHKIKHEDDGEDLSDVKPYSHVEDVAEYVHNLRRERIR
jgi:DNA gyrase/topoisomerase IV subunit B